MLDGKLSQYLAAFFDDQCSNKLKSPYSSQAFCSLRHNQQFVVQYALYLQQFDEIKAIRKHEQARLKFLETEFLYLDSFPVSLSAT